MKTKIVFIVILFCGAIRMTHGQMATELFIKAPEVGLLSLTFSNRMDLIDLYKAEGKATIKNHFNDSCSILRLTDDYLQIQIGKHTTEIFLLHLINDSKVVGIIQTVCAPVCDSSLEFYTIAWKKLATSAFITFANKEDFLKDGVQPKDEEVKNALIPLDISLMRLHYDPDKHELQQYYTTPEYLSPTDRNKAMLYLNDTPKLFKWNLARFK